MTKVFSIKEQYSSKIFKKEKTMELRRQNINVKKNELCFIYTTSPKMTLSGYFIVKEKIRQPIEKLWNTTKKFSGISKKQFFDYFKGCLEGTAIVFKKVKKFVRGIPLSSLRNNIHFQPPQSFYNLSKEDFIKINNIFESFKLNQKIPETYI